MSEIDFITTQCLFLLFISSYNSRTVDGWNITKDAFGKSVFFRL